MAATESGQSEARADNQNLATSIPDPAVVWNRGRSESFAYAHLSAETSDQIISWLGREGFGSLNAAMRSVIDWYVARGSSFVVITAREPTPSAGHVDVSIRFPSSKPYYPMKVSSIGFDGSMSLDLYLCGPTAMTVAYDLPAHDQGTELNAFSPVSDFVFDFDYERRRFSRRTRYAYQSPQVVDPYVSLSELVPEREAEEISTEDIPFPSEAYLADPAFFWQTAALRLGAGDELRRQISEAVQAGTAPTDELWLTSFVRKYDDVADMIDLVGMEKPQPQFRGGVYATINVWKEDAGARRTAGIDLGVILPIAFLVLLKAFGRSKARARYTPHSRCSARSSPWQVP
jgi:hypothetical protein